MVIGAGPWQGWFIQTIKTLRVGVLAIDGNPDAFWSKEADHFHPVDVKDHEAILRLVETYQPINAVSAASDIALPAQRLVQKAMGWPTLSDFTHDHSSNKLRMHEIFEVSRVPTCPYVLAKDAQETRRAAQKIGFPVVLKPLSNSGGRGVIKVNSDAEVAPGYDYTHHFSDTDHVLVEQFVVGEGICAEVFMHNGKRVYSILIRNHFVDDYISPIGHMLPSGLSDSQQETIQTEVSKICTAFKLENGNFNIDMKMTNQGPIFLEVNPRMGGANISELIWYASGVNIAEYAAAQALGRDIPPFPAIKFQPTISCLLATHRKGTVIAKSQLRLKASEEALVQNYTIIPQAGTVVDSPKELVSLIGWAILSGESMNKLSQVARKFLAHDHLTLGNA